MNEPILNHVCAWDMVDKIWYNVRDDCMQVETHDGHIYQCVGELYFLNGEIYSLFGINVIS